MNEELSILFYFLLFIVAFLYSSVGHGGASGYLALMALFGFLPEVMKPTALVLNIFVSLVAFTGYFRKNYFSWQLFIPLAVASIPAAYLGGIYTIPDNTYRQILGVLLLIPVFRFFIPVKNEEVIKDKIHVPALLCMGGSIGFISGLIGIGGGVILSPLLLLLKWSDIRRIAGISSLFIFVNSMSGLLGQLNRSLTFSNSMIAMTAVAFAGGIAGSYSGSSVFRSNVLRILLSIVLLIAAIKLIMS